MVRKRLIIIIHLFTGSFGAMYCNRSLRISAIFYISPFDIQQSASLHVLRIHLWILSYPLDHFKVQCQKLQVRITRGRERGGAIGSQLINRSECGGHSSVRAHRYHTPIKQSSITCCDRVVGIAVIYLCLFGQHFLTYGN